MYVDLCTICEYKHNETVLLLASFIPVSNDNGCVTFISADARCSGICKQLSVQGECHTIVCKNIGSKFTLGTCGKNNETMCRFTPRKSYEKLFATGYG